MPMPGDFSGYYKGKHYTAYVEAVKALKRVDALDQAEKLLLDLLGAVENESYAHKWDPAPWYYTQLAIIYRKQKRYSDEAAIINRYLGNPYIKPGNTVFEARLEKLIQLMKDYHEGQAS